MLYVPVAPPTGIVIDSFAEAVLQLVLKEVVEGMVSVMLSLVERVPSFAVNVNVTSVSNSTLGAMKLVESEVALLNVMSKDES